MTKDEDNSSRFFSFPNVRLGNLLARQDGTDDGEMDALAHVSPALAKKFLTKTHGDQAGEEALMRALICERQLHHNAARFWLGIYALISDV
ncbi:MAG: hypothetical protein JKY63_03160 [Rhodobiaceae bacterium]|nr:hypothetical protein [Rhodobiaceae bacterium]